MFYLAEFLLKAQHHSGLPWTNPSCINHAVKLSAVVDDCFFSGFLPENAVEAALNDYMIEIHKNYRKNKKWKSYDW